MKLSPAALAAALGAALAGPAFADSLAMDTPVTVGDGLETVCTGIADSKQDPRWPAYPVRIEFSNGGAQYLAGAHLVLTAGGKVWTPHARHHKKTASAVQPGIVQASFTPGAPLATVDCDGAWVLFKLPAGTYTATASLLHGSAPPRTAVFATTGAPPQKRVVIQFPLQPNM